VDPQISVANDNSAVLSSDINLPTTHPLALQAPGHADLHLVEQDQRRRRDREQLCWPRDRPRSPTPGIIRFGGQRGPAADYTGGFWLRGSARQQRRRTGARAKFASPRTALSFGAGTTPGDPALSTQRLRIGESSAAGGNA